MSKQFEVLVEKAMLGVMEGKRYELFERKTKKASGYHRHTVRLLTLVKTIFKMKKAVLFQKPYSSSFFPILKIFQFSPKKQNPGGNDCLKKCHLISL